MKGIYMYSLRIINCQSKYVPFDDFLRLTPSSFLLTGGIRVGNHLRSYSKSIYVQFFQ